MRIALTSDAPGLEGHVPALYSQSPFLLIVNAESGELLHSIARGACGDSGEEQDIFLAREILRWDCEGLLCGGIERPPFLIIADEGCVTRYNAAGLSTSEALKRLGARSLELIRDHIGGKGCQGLDKETKGGSSCECGHHGHG